MPQLFPVRKMDLNLHGKEASVVAGLIASGAISDSKVAANAAIQQSKIAGLVSDLAAIVASVTAEQTRASGQEAAIRSEFAAADAALDVQISEEVTRALAAEAALQAALTQESSARSAAVSAEQTARTTADDVLDGKITTEKNRADAAELVLTNNLAQEVLDRIAGDAALDGRLDTLEGDDTVVGSVAHSVKAEETRALAAEAGLASDLVDEVTRATARENEIASDLADEIARALAAESTIRSDFEAADAALDGRLDILEGSSATPGSVAHAIAQVVGAAPEALDTLKEIADQLANDESVVNALINTVAANLVEAKAYTDDEETRAMAAEAALQTELDAEEARAAAAELALQGEIDAEEARAVAAEGVLQGNIDLKFDKAGGPIDQGGTVGLSAAPANTPYSEFHHYVRNYDSAIGNETNWESTLGYYPHSWGVNNPYGNRVESITSGDTVIKILDEWAQASLPVGRTVQLVQNELVNGALEPVVKLTATVTALLGTEQIQVPTQWGMLTQTYRLVQLSAAAPQDFAGGLHTFWTDTATPEAEVSGAQVSFTRSLERFDENGNSVSSATEEATLSSQFGLSVSKGYLGGNEQQNAYLCNGGSGSNVAEFDHWSSDNQKEVWFTQNYDKLHVEATVDNFDNSVQFDIDATGASLMDGNDEALMPIADKHLVVKKYVDDADNLKFNKAGGAIDADGVITLSDADATLSLGASNIQMTSDHLFFPDAVSQTTLLPDALTMMVTHDDGTVESGVVSPGGLHYSLTSAAEAVSFAAQGSGLVFDSQDVNAVKRGIMSSNASFALFAFGDSLTLATKTEVKVDVTGVTLTDETGAPVLPAADEHLVVKKYVDDAIDALGSSSNGDLALEITNRTNADQVLQGNIDAEEAARIAGDTATLSSAEAYTDQKIADLVDSAPALLDTLNELAAALGDDPNFSTTILNAISTEQTRAEGAEAALDGRLDVLEAKSFREAFIDDAVGGEVELLKPLGAPSIPDSAATEFYIDGRKMRRGVHFEVAADGSKVTFSAVDAGVMVELRYFA